MGRDPAPREGHPPGGALHPKRDSPLAEEPSEQSPAATVRPTRCPEQPPALAAAERPAAWRRDADGPMPRYEGRRMGSTTVAGGAAEVAAWGRNHKRCQEKHPRSMHPG